MIKWGCNSPRQYQIEAIFQLVYTKIDMMYLIRKTGDGKSLVLQGTASILKGITIVMVPLIGLGSDQAQKCNIVGDDNLCVESYHLDEFKNNNALELRERLHEYTCEEKTAIIVFVSPQQLAKHSLWRPVLMSLAHRGCVSAVCVDEVHCTVHNYESFRPEFKTSIDSLNEIVGIARRTNPDKFYVPILAMSATFPIADQQEFNKLIGRLPTVVMWGEMARRNISFSVDVAGDPIHAFSKDWIQKPGAHPTRQSLVYSNSAKSCNGSILNKLANARKCLPPTDGVFLSITGDCGIMLKTYLMAAFAGEATEETNSTAPTSTGELPTMLPNILCMPCTSAANCGISSKRCSFCFRIGPPPSWHEMVQEMGRVDRAHNSITDTNSYKIYMNFNTFLSLWQRVQSEVNDVVRQRQLGNLMEILTLLVLPRRCFHDAIENHFENPATYESNPSCNNNCSFCDGSYINLCGTISKSNLITVLTTIIFHNGVTNAMSLVLMISSNANSRVKSAIWMGKKDVTPGNVHALLLMLIASNIIQLELFDNATPSDANNLILLRNVNAVLTK